MNKKYNLQDAIDFVTGGDISDLSELSDDNDDDEIIDNPDISLVNDEDSSSDEDDNVPLSTILENQVLPEDQVPGPSTRPRKPVYRWRKKDTPHGTHPFNGEFSDPPEIDTTPLHYFSLFFQDSLIDLVVENTNLYSVQCTGKSINTTSDEIRKFIGMHVMMGIIVLPAYTLYWSKKMRISQIADVMTLKRFQLLKRYMHFVDNNTFTNTDDKLFKIKPVVDAVRMECLKIEPEESHSIDEQIIPSKTRYTKIRQYNPKKPPKWGFKNLVRAGASGYMYDFYIYSGKNEAPVERYSHLQKSAQVVAKLCEHLPTHKHHKLFFDNWFTTLDLIQYLKKNGILAVGTIRANRTAGCPVMSNKDLEKEGRGALDYRVDQNSGIIIVKWVDNSTVQLTSNYIGVEPVSTIKRWNKTEMDRTDVPCPQIVKSYNQSMGGVDLVDMLISLYRIKVKTRRWYIKIFWHLVDVAKVNGWILYRRHQDQHVVPKRSQQPLQLFSLELADALIKHSQVATYVAPGRPTKRKSMEPIRSGKKPATATPYDDSRYDQLGHWPLPSETKQRCRICKAYVRIQCEKCKIYLCLLADRNCFRDFHFKH